MYVACLDDVKHQLHYSFQGRVVTLNEDDVWDLSPTMQSRPIFIKFTTIQFASQLSLIVLPTHLESRNSSLLRRLLTANSLDFMYVVVIFQNAIFT